MIKIPKSTYGANVASLGIVSGNNIGWHTCREQFHNAIIHCKVKDFLFCCNVTEKEKIVTFIAIVQDKIGLSNSNRVEISNTTQDNIIHIKVSPWWAAQNIRLSFLTALLRCGRSYNGDFRAALFSTKYTAETKPAVDLFLGGRSKYLGNGSQWQATFSVYNGKVDYAERTLIKDDEPDITDEAMEEAKHIISHANEGNEILTIMLAKSLDKFYQDGKGDKKKKRIVGD